MNHLAPLDLLLDGSVVVLQTVLPKLLLHLNLPTRRPQKGKLRAVKVFLHLVTDAGRLLTE